jgi:hypothetical protein
MVEEPATALVEVVMWNGINEVSAGNSKDSGSLNVVFQIISLE